MADQRAPELLDPGAAWRPGAAIGRYALIMRIAVGGMAEIWLARESGLKGFERVVVIKKISDALSQDASFIEMFLDEARIAAQLAHPNIIQIFELGEHAGAYYIAMEYLPGEDVAAIVRATRAANLPMPFSYTARIIADAASGLASAHSRLGLDGKPLNVVHRDVSPQNLIVTYEGAVKVVDFGIAKAANRASTTSSGQLKGKFSYMSPEQITGEEVDGRADVWSLGVVLFEAITATRLFSFKDDQLKTRWAVSGSDPIPRASTRLPTVPSELDAIIEKALTRDRNRRYVSAHAFQSALEGWIRTQPRAPVGPDLATFMGMLFADRMAKRVALIEAVSRGEPGFTGTPPGIRPPTERSMPGLSPVGLFTRRSRLAVWIASLAALGIVAVGLGLLARGAGEGGLDFDSVPSGAKVLLDGNAAGTAPLSLEGVKAGEHVVTATLEGLPAQSRAVKVSARGRTSLQIVFPPAAKVEPAAPVSVVVDAGVPAAPVGVDPKKLVVMKRPVGRGTLTLETNPWTRVFENGKLLGETPLIQLSLPAGNHKFKLVNPDKGINQVLEVTVLPNKSTTKRVAF